MQGRRVAVTGVGVVSALGLSRDEYWNNLVNGRSGIRRISRFDASQHTSQIAGEIAEWDPSPWLERAQIQRSDRFCQFGLVAAIEAVRDSGLDFDREDRTRAGVVIGTGIGGLGEMEAEHRRLIERGPRRVRPFLVPKLMANAASGQVSIHFGIYGPNTTVVTACAASTHSLGMAFHMLRNGMADIIFAGGTEAAITPLGLAGFCAARALSTRNDEPEKASRPFDAGRDGFVMAEGAGVVILEEMEHARNRGAHIYAEFRGFGMSGDAMHLTQPNPDGRGAAQAMKEALADARMSPDEIDYVNAHGTSTPLNDAMETRACKTVFGEGACKVPVSSTKSMIGHALGGSGGLEMVALAMTVDQQVMHPTVNQETPDPECDLDYVPNEARQGNIAAAMSNSFGFGGHNASIIIARV